MASTRATCTSAILGVFLLAGQAMRCQQSQNSNSTVNGGATIPGSNATESGADHQPSASLLGIGQDPSAKATADSVRGPTLEETISFMSRSVAPENSYLTSANHCELTIVRNRLYEFAMPKSTYVKSTDTHGVPHHAIDWMLLDEPAQFLRFDLATIDQKSIESRTMWSTQFLKAHDVDEHPEALKEADLTVVFFEAANSEQSIELGKLSADSGKANASEPQVSLPVFDRKESMAFIAFESKDRAERFVTAFIHAVDLCGGKASDFAPTPSKQ